MHHLSRLMLGVAAATLVACAVAPDQPIEQANPQAEESTSDWATYEPGGGTSCSDGSDYQFHVREGDPDKLFLFFNGGGACWNSETCGPGERRAFVPRADLPHNHPNSHFGVFDLANPDNPLTDWTMVFAAYCTGDVHLGAKTREYTSEDGRTITIEHNGVANAMSVIDWVTSNLDPKEIIVSGGSAGALASPYYAMLTAKAYPESDVLQFAGGGGAYQVQQADKYLKNWGSDALLDVDAYSPVDKGEADLYSFYNVEPVLGARIRYAIYDAAYDTVQASFLNLLDEPISVQDAVGRTYADLDKLPMSVSQFLGRGEGHTILRHKEFYTQQVGDQKFMTWFASLLNGETPPQVDCGDTEEGCLVQVKETQSVDAE